MDCRSGGEDHRDTPSLTELHIKREPYQSRAWDDGNIFGLHGSNITDLLQVPKTRLPLLSHECPVLLINSTRTTTRVLTEF